MTKKEKYIEIHKILLNNVDIKNNRGRVTLYQVTGTQRYFIYSSSSLADHIIDNNYSYLTRKFNIIYEPFHIIAGGTYDETFDARQYFTVNRDILSMDDDSFKLWLRLQ